MHLLSLCAAFALLSHSSSAASDTKPKPFKPCTIRSSTSGAFFDLNPITVVLPPKDAKKPKDARVESWHAKGYDYGANFTLNVCGPVVEPLQDVVGVDEARWKNVSAFYNVSGKIYSIGEQNAEPIFRGRKLVLNYTNGSPCPSDLNRRSLLQHELEDVLPRKLIEHDDKDENRDGRKRPASGDKDENHDGRKKPASDDRKTVRRKSTVISLLCDKDPLAPKATVAFVAASPDECTYFFEARSAAACGGIEVARQQLGPSGVFGVIALIAVLVYLGGGCVYQRTVMHQRGWRQLPNYSLWAGIGGFIKDMFIILTSSCARFLPSRRGYSRVTMNGNGRGRGSHSDDENRLIDQLDEEWDD